MSRIKLILKYVFAVFFVVAGINHFVNPAFFLKIMPPYLPWHLPLVYISGVCEIVLGALLLWPSWSRIAAWGLIALLIAVFPANLHMAVNTDQYADVASPFVLWLRLPMQGVFIAWAYWLPARER